MTKVKATNFAQEIVEAANMIFEKKEALCLVRMGIKVLARFLNN